MKAGDHCERVLCDVARNRARQSASLSAVSDTIGLYKLVEGEEV